MATPRKRKREDSQRTLPPATTPEARENQMIFLATELAERQLREGTASAQVISHYLKLGSTRERLEQNKLHLENEFLEARREQLESQQRVEELYAQALASMRRYSGTVEAVEPDEYE